MTDVRNDELSNLMDVQQVALCFFVSKNESNLNLSERSGGICSPLELQTSPHLILLHS